MSTWRQKALVSFPDLRGEFQRPDATIYTLFFELLPRCVEAHQNDDLFELEKIYAFAEWCMEQKAKDIWNAAAVSFYEHLPDHPRTLRDMAHWVTPQIFAQVESLLQWRMTPSAFEKLKAEFCNEQDQGFDDRHEKATRGRKRQPRFFRK